MYKAINSIKIKNSFAPERLRHFARLWRRYIFHISTSDDLKKYEKKLWKAQNREFKQIEGELTGLGAMPEHNLNLDKLDLPVNSDLDCSNQWVGSLNIGEKQYKRINCSKNILRDLKIGANVEEINCDDNPLLQNLDLTHASGLKKLKSKNCRLEPLQIPESLELLEADITALPDMETLKSLKNKNLEIFVKLGN